MIDLILELAGYNCVNPAGVHCRSLAEALLENCEIARYTLVDFSPQMLDLSRSRLAKFQDRTVFVQADFKKADWAAKIRAGFDLIVSLQAVHELRHASRIPKRSKSICRRSRRLVSSTQEKSAPPQT